MAELQDVFVGKHILKALAIISKTTSHCQNVGQYFVKNPLKPSTNLNKMSHAGLILDLKHRRTTPSCAEKVGLLVRAGSFDAVRAA